MELLAMSCSVLRAEGPPVFCMQVQTQVMKKLEIVPCRTKMPGKHPRQEAQALVTVLNEAGEGRRK